MAQATQNGKVQVVEGTLEARNDRGLKVGGQWYDFSKFSPVQPPDVGAQVRLTVSGGRWVKALEVLTPAETPTGAPDRTETEAPAPDRLAVRKYALALAVRLYSTDAGSTWASTENVLAMASAFEEWLLR